MNSVYGEKEVRLHTIAFRSMRSKSLELADFLKMEKAGASERRWRVKHTVGGDDSCCGEIFILIHQSVPPFHISYLLSFRCCGEKLVLVHLSGLLLSFFRPLLSYQKHFF